MVLKKNPIKLTGFASIDTDELHINVDEQAGYIAQYDKGELSIMCSGIRTTMSDTAYIYGTKGYLVLPKFWKPSKMQIVIGDKSEEIERRVAQHIPNLEDEGYQYEIAHVNDCLRKGLQQSPVVTWEETRAVLEQCDKLRTDWGLHYPQE